MKSFQINRFFNRVLQSRSPIEFPIKFQVWWPDSGRRLRSACLVPGDNDSLCKASWYCEQEPFKWHRLFLSKDDGFCKERPDCRLESSTVGSSNLEQTILFSEESSPVHHAPLSYSISRRCYQATLSAERLPIRPYRGDLSFSPKRSIWPDQIGALGLSTQSTLFAHQQSLASQTVFFISFFNHI